MLIPYVRRSRKDEEVVSIQQQLDSIRDWSTRTGTELAEPIIERGVSGGKPWRERELGDVIQRCKAGKADGVVVGYFSRLTRERNSATWEVLEELEPFRLVAVREGIDSPPGEAADWNQAIQGFQAHGEWRTLSKHLAAGKHATWQSGRLINRWVPAGYEIDPEQTPGSGFPIRKSEHAESVARALTARASGGSWSEVARLLTAAGVPTRSGSTRWTTQAARAIARNPLYRGEHRCACGCGESVLRPELALVTADVWKKAQPAKGEGPGRKDAGKALLAGLLRCATCGEKLGHASTHGGRYRNYRCRNIYCAARASISAPQVEALAQDEALALWQATDPVVGRTANLETIVQLEHDRDALTEEVAAYVQHVPATTPGFAEGLTSRQSRLEEVEANLLAERTATLEQLDADTMQTVFEAGSVEEKRRVIRAFLSGIVVRPGREPVPDRIEFVPKPVVFA